MNSSSGPAPIKFVKSSGWTCRCCGTENDPAGGYTVPSWQGLIDVQCVKCGVRTNLVVRRCPQCDSTVAGVRALCRDCTFLSGPMGPMGPTVAAASATASATATAVPGGPSFVQAPPVPPSGTSCSSWVKDGRHVDFFPPPEADTTAVQSVADERTDICSKCGRVFGASGPAIMSARVCPHCARADAVDHPPHYNAHPSGIECIQVVEHMGFNIGNAIKYLWRADEKGAPIQDLKKSIWYIQREIDRRSKP